MHAPDQRKEAARASKRRLRANQKAGAIVPPVLILREFVEVCVDLGLLTPEASRDRNQVARLASATLTE
jgi:hypothetical protein